MIAWSTASRFCRITTIKVELLGPDNRVIGEVELPKGTGPSNSTMRGIAAVLPTRRGCLFCSDVWSTHLCGRLGLHLIPPQLLR